MSPRRKYSFAAILADAVGLTHFILANLIVLVGEVTDVFFSLSEKHGGVAFVYRYLDAPIFAVFSPILGTTNFDDTHTLMVAEMVIAAASIFYGFVVYVVCRAIKAISV